MSGRSLVALGFAFLIIATVAAPIESEDAFGSSSTLQDAPDNSNPTTVAAPNDDPSSTVIVPGHTSNGPEPSGGSTSASGGGSTSQQETRGLGGSTDGGASPASEVPQPSGETVQPDTEGPNSPNPPNPSGATSGHEETTPRNPVTGPNHSEPPVTKPPPHTDKPASTTPPSSDDGTTAGGSDTENPHSGATGPVHTASSSVTGSSTQGTIPTTTGTQGLHATLSLLTVFVARFLF